MARLLIILVFIMYCQNPCKYWVWQADFHTWYGKRDLWNGLTYDPEVHDTPTREFLSREYELRYEQSYPGADSVTVTLSQRCGEDTVHRFKWKIK